MKQLKINHLAVWLSIVLLHVLGFLWYGPLFQEPWLEAVGLTMEEADAASTNMGMWITNSISIIIPVYVLAWLFTKLNIDNLVSGLATGILIAFAFYLLPRMTADMFAQSPYGLTWIVGGYNLTAMGLSGLILGAWKKHV